MYDISYVIHEYKTFIVSRKLQVISLYHYPYLLVYYSCLVIDTDKKVNRMLQLDSPLKGFYQSCPVLISYLIL